MAIQIERADAQMSHMADTFAEICQPVSSLDCAISMAPTTASEACPSQEARCSEAHALSTTTRSSALDESPDVLIRDAGERGGRIYSEYLSAWNGRVLTFSKCFSSTCRQEV